MKEPVIGVAAVFTRSNLQAVLTRSNTKHLEQREVAAIIFTQPRRLTTVIASHQPITTKGRTVVLIISQDALIEITSMLLHQLMVKLPRVVQQRPHQLLSKLR